MPTGTRGKATTLAAAALAVASFGTSAGAASTAATATVAQAHAPLYRPMYEEPAYLAAIRTVRPDGRVSVELTTNGNEVQIRYRKSGRTRTRTYKKWVEPPRVVTLPAGSTQIRARMLKTTSFQAGKWQPALEQATDSVAIPEGVSYWSRPVQGTVPYVMVVIRAGNLLQTAENWRCRSGRLTGRAYLYRAHTAQIDEILETDSESFQDFTPIRQVDAVSLQGGQLRISATPDRQDWTQRTRDEAYQLLVTEGGLWVGGQPAGGYVTGYPDVMAHNCHFEDPYYQLF